MIITAFIYYCYYANVMIKFAIVEVGVVAVPIIIGGDNDKDLQ